MTIENKIYTTKLEKRVEELEDIIENLRKEILGYHIEFEVYYLILNKNDMVDECIQHTTTFKTYDEAFKWTQNYLKRKRKRKNLDGFEILEKKMEVEGSYARFWTINKKGKITRRGDDSKN